MSQHAPVQQDSLLTRIRDRIQREKNALVIRRIRRQIPDHDFTVLSQNCIGGVLYHDLGAPFLSPTVNLFIPAKDFLRLCADVKGYMQKPLCVTMGESWPAGMLGDVRIEFMHYASCEEAEAAWARRAARIRYDRIAIVGTDRDGFDDEAFALWQTIPHPKVLFTANSAYAQHEDSVYLPRFSENGAIADLIPGRAFYKSGKLVRAVNAACRPEEDSP